MIVRFSSNFLNGLELILNEFKENFKIKIMDLKSIKTLHKKNRNMS